MYIKRSPGFEKMARNFNNSLNTEFTIKDAEKTLRDAGFSRKEAKSILAIGYDASAALYGWPVDTPRDAGRNGKPQTEQLRDAVASGPNRIIEDIMQNIRKLH